MKSIKDTLIEVLSGHIYTATMRIKYAENDIEKEQAEEELLAYKFALAKVVNSKDLE